MEKVISAKAKKKLETILDLKVRLNNWQSYSEDELFNLVKEFEKRPRDEGSFWYNDALSDKNFASVLLDIAEHNQKNIKLNVYIVSALGNMIQRYNLESSDEIFNYLLKNSQRKGIALYVSFFLPYLPQFEKYEGKWEYIMSIKKITPGKDAEESFRVRINFFINQLPDHYTQEVISYFEQCRNNAKSDYSKSVYKELIGKLASKK